MKHPYQRLNASTSSPHDSITPALPRFSLPSAVPLLLAAGFLTLAVSAADKNGVSPNAISLPSGPGSIEGLGESFQPMLSSGTARYHVALKVPTGTAGHAPVLGLTYEGGGGNGPLGFGWRLPFRCVQRQCDKGIPRYVDGPNSVDDDLDGEIDEADEIDPFINEIKEELVPQADGHYFCENEGAFIRYRRNGDHWEATLPNGTRLEFGLTPEGRVADATGRVFCWLLEKEIDTHGNTILYSYRSFPEPANLNQKYCEGVAYGPGAPPWENFHFIVLDYEDRTDGFEDGRAGFLVRTGKRLKKIIVGTQGPTLSGHLAGDFNGDGKTDYLVRKYGLGYLDYHPPDSHWSLLSEVLTIGADGAGTLPPARFGYAVCNPPDTVSAAGQLIGGTNEPPAVMDNPLVELVDLNGDALPDILKTEQFGGAHSARLNQGQAGSDTDRVIRWSPPVEVTSTDGWAWTVNLESASEIAHLSDMDGDGLADLVYKSAIGDVFYFVNQGRLGWGTRRPMSIQDSAPPSPFGNPEVRSADIDFDKRMDVIQSISTGTGADYRIWFNRGNQRYSRSVTVPQTSGFLFSTKGVHLADFNGDRVPDVVRIQPAALTVTAGLGHGRFADPVTVNLPDFTLDTAQFEKAALQDITGDGLADLVIERAAPGQLWYWVNQGNYTLTTRKLITGLPTGIGLNAVMRWADLNGNGTTDLMYADSTSIPRLLTVDVGELLGCVPRPNTLTTIENGIGRKFTIRYEPSTKFALEDAAAGASWPDPLPFPASVVAEVLTDDSLGHTYVTRYRYHDGYYDGVEKEFRGFAQAEQIDVGDPTAPTLVTHSYFDTGRNHEAMKGRLLRVTARQEDGKVFSEESTSWTSPPKALMTGINGQTVNYAHPTAMTRVVSELGQGTARRLEVEYGYDNYGNVTRNADYGIVVDGDPSAFDDERITTTEYALNLEKWIVRHPARQEIKDEHGVVISRLEYFYDDETFSGTNFGQVTSGNLTLRREWIRPQEPAAGIAAARTQYDAFGNPIVLLDPLAAAPGGNIDSGAGHYRDIAYDDRFHAYPVLETIHVGGGKSPLVIEVGYNDGFGTILFSRDFNGHETTYSYDAFARLVRVVKPGDSPEFPTVEHEYVLAQPFGVSGVINYTETRMLDKAPGSAGPLKRDHYLISRQFVDGLGRGLMTKQEAEPDPVSGAPRVVVNGAVLFNARLSPALNLNPYYSLASGGGLETLWAFEDIRAPGWNGAFHEDGELKALTLDGAHQTSTEYDATLRPIRTINQDGTFQRTVYEPLVTRQYDENDTDPVSPHFDTPTVFHSDGLGRRIRTDEIVRLNDDGTPATELKTWSTRYEYDLNDQLTRIIDSQDNVKIMEYDGLKRMTFLNDPNRGAMNYVYDEASNLIETTDAKNQRITYTYDGVNRLVTEDYHDEDRPFSFNHLYDPAQPLSPANRPDVAYFYDAPVPGLDQGDGTVATARNTKGFLAYAWDLSGEEHSSFDDRGRVEYVLKRIADPVHQQLVPYTTHHFYDSADRLIRLVFPDNDEATYRYNERSLLQRIPGGPSGSVVSNITYVPSGQKEMVEYGNSVRTSYRYDARLRLTELRAHNPDLGADLMHFSYDFDPAKNIVSIHDHRAASAAPGGDPRRNTQLFQYDDLYRLRRAQYSFNLPAESLRDDGAIEYRYDRIGNMLAQTSTIDHLENGLPLANLGEMESGGSLGRFNRIGRSPSDPPGPHALSRIENLKFAPRTYDYDGNGNVINMDGSDCTWDFKDRLVAVENSGMRAEYTYDHTDRRIIKKVVPKPPIAGNGPFSTVYVNRFFEVREHEQPTKYVWDGETRVARVIGSLSNNSRVQRLRIFPGWNLVSLAVSSTNTAAQLNKDATIDALYRWNLQTKDYADLTEDQDLSAGAVLWLKTSAHATLHVTGAYTDPANVPIAVPGGYYPCPGFEVLTTTNSLPADAVVWRFGEEDQSWRLQLPAEHPLSYGALSFPAFQALLSPGEGLFIRTSVPAELQTPAAALRIRYYHQDHLGSTSIMADGTGRVLESNAFYPFGRVRSSYTPGASVEYFGFTQKERDRETGFHYFEARYLATPLGRFLTPDPLHPGRNGRLSFDNPQLLHIYSYGRNNPLRIKDPTGLQPVEKARSVGVGGSAIAIIGVHASVGLVNDEETGISLYFSYGFLVGPALAAGVGIEVGDWESSQKFLGESWGAGGTVGPVAAEVAVEPKSSVGPAWDKPYGGSISVAKSVGAGVYMKRSFTSELAGEATEKRLTAQKGGIAEIARKAEAAAKAFEKEIEEVNRATARMKPLYELRLDPTLHSEE